MRKIFTCLLFILFSIGLRSQIGVHVRYDQFNLDKYEDFSGAVLFDDSYEIGLDYWLRLKYYRVEFQNEVFRQISSTTFNNIDYKFNSWGLAVNTLIYPFDIYGDCDCPTFSKQGNFFTKGFFFSASPILKWNQYQLTSELSDKKEDQLTFVGAIGAGLDIGIYDLVTITPYVRYAFMPGLYWSAMNDPLQSDLSDEKVNEQMIQVGIRIGIRADYVREQRRFR